MERLEKRRTLVDSERLCASRFSRPGVFRALFLHIEKLGAADVDCCGIRLYMERENETARASYRRLGFHETGYVVFERLFARSNNSGS